MLLGAEDVKEQSVWNKTENHWKPNSEIINFQWEFILKGLPHKWKHLCNRGIIIVTEISVYLPNLSIFNKTSAAYFFVPNHFHFAGYNWETFS